MSFKKDRKRKECIDAVNGKASTSQLATGLGANRANIETRQKSVEKHSQEAVREIMEALEKASLEGDSPQEVCERVKITINDILNRKMPGIINMSMERIRAKNTLGTSMLDEPTPGYTEDSEIKIFLDNLGIDLDNKSDLHYAKKIFAEAFVYLHGLLLNEKIPSHRKIIPTLHPNVVKRVKKWYQKEKKESVSISKKLTNEERISRGLDKEQEEREFIDKEIVKLLKKDDILNFFRVAAGYGSKQKGLAKQACALLRIAYAIDYVERDPQISLLEEALKKLLEKKERHFIDKRVCGDRVWKYRLGQNRLHMPIQMLEIRTKERSGIITKLLHKPGNRSGKVLDHIGMRVTTKNAIDTLKLIYYMFFNVETQMFPYMSIRIDETKNLILDANQIEEIIDDDERAQNLVDMLSKETIDHKELSDILADDDITTTENSNRLSAPKYKAIHIIVDLPVHSKKYGRISFPIEVQILDKKSQLGNEQKAPHASYKERQNEVVLQRVVHQNNIETVLAEKNGRKNGRKKNTTPSLKSLQGDCSKK